MKQKLTETCFKENTLFDGVIIKVKKDEVILPNEQRAYREVVIHNGGSCILAVKDDKVLLVRQFRYAVGCETWEIPAGKVDIGENPLDTAIRELEEETGLIPQDITLIYETYPTPGYSSEHIYIYFAKTFKQGNVHLDENEFLNCKWFDLLTLKNMISTGEIKDGKTIIALQYLFLNA